jgi:hypothetical protein
MRDKGKEKESAGELLTPEGIGIGVVKLELHLFDKVRYIVLADAPDGDGPLVRVVRREVRRLLVRVHGGCDGAIDWWEITCMLTGRS